MRAVRICETLWLDSLEKYGVVYTLYRACLVLGVLTFFDWLVGILIRGLWIATKPDGMKKMGHSLLIWIMCLITASVPLTIAGFVFRVVL